MNGKISNPAQIAYVRRYTLSAGKENGLKVIEVNNGKLRFLLNESKALDIMQLWHEGVNISFLSKNGFTAQNLPFLQRFEGGMLYTCGLDSIGSREGFELHGTLHNTPARVTTCTEDGNTLIVKANIATTSLFGKNLLLCRTIKTDILSDTLTLEDELINCSAKETEYCLLYHVNLGYPFLDKGVTIASDAENVIPRNAWAQKKLANRTVFSDCIEDEEECCYFLQHKTPEIQVKNEKLKKTFTLRYSNDTLPCFVQWNSATSGDYALGIEPCTSYLDDQFVYRTIGAQEKIKFTLQMRIS